MNGFSIQFQSGELHEEIFVDCNRFDSFVFENSELKIVLEGLIINKKLLLRENACPDLASLVIKLFKAKKEKFPNELDGEFRGYLWDKIAKRLIIFTNHTATQRIFYYQSKNLIFADSSLVRLSKTLQKSGIQLRPNIENIYQLPAFGNMLEDCTPIEKAYKLKDGHVLVIDANGLKTARYSQMSLAFNGTKSDAIEQADELFRTAAKNEYLEDSGRRSVTFLSGGLDSRLALFAGLDSGFQPQEVLCFSQSGYWDEKISKKIASDFQLDYRFVPLDGGMFLSEIDELTKISEGTCHYTGGIHLQFAVGQLDGLADIFHSGQLGDAFLGGYNTVPKITAPNRNKILQRPEFLPKVRNYLSQTLQNYEREEYFYLRNIGFSRTVLGAQVLNQFGLQLSPFMGKDFIDFSMSLPPEWKFKQKFYIEWLNKKFPDAARYRWERSLMKPDAAWKTAFGDKVMTRLHKYGNLLIGKGFAVTMTPYQYYFDHSADLQKIYRDYYHDNFDRLNAYPDLKSDVQELFASPKFYDKSMAVNILSIFKLYF